MLDGGCVGGRLPRSDGLLFRVADIVVGGGRGEPHSLVKHLSPISFGSPPPCKRQFLTNFFFTAKTISAFVTVRNFFEYFFSFNAAAPKLRATPRSRSRVHVPPSCVSPIRIREEGWGKRRRYIYILL